MPRKRYGPDNTNTRRNLDSIKGWNNAQNRYQNLKQDRANKRVKTPTSSMFYYAAGEARKIERSGGGTIKATTMVSKTGGSRRKSPGFGL